MLSVFTFRNILCGKVKLFRIFILSGGGSGVARGMGG